MMYRVLKKLTSLLLSTALLALLTSGAFAQGKKDEKPPKEPPPKIKVPDKPPKGEDKKPQEGEKKPKPEYSSFE